MSALVRWWDTQRSQTKVLQEKIQELGAAGFVAYGMLNSLYYCTAFTFCWLFVAQAPKGLGVSVTTAKMVQVLGLTWAGSQVTKIARAGCAIIMAPFVERMAKYLTERLSLKSLYIAYGMVIGVCILFSGSVFGLIFLLWS